MNERTYLRKRPFYSRTTTSPYIYTTTTLYTHSDTPNLISSRTPHRSDPHHTAAAAAAPLGRNHTHAKLSPLSRETDADNAITHCVSYIHKLSCARAE